jgi:hypothetical protein
MQFYRINKVSDKGAALLGEGVQKLLNLKSLKINF